VLPYRPLLMGTLVNTLVWSVPFAIVILLALGLRRLLRYESGCCPTCKYDLRRDFSRGCPECGWRRDAEALIEK